MSYRARYRYLSGANHARLECLPLPGVIAHEPCPDEQLHEPTSDDVDRLHRCPLYTALYTRHSAFDEHFVFDRPSLTGRCSGHLVSY